MAINLSAAKAHLRVTSSSEDSTITIYLNAAISWIERYTRKKLTAATSVSESFDQFGDYLQLRWGPFETIDDVVIAYTDTSGGAQTITDVVVRDNKVFPASTWPDILENSEIIATYKAGFTAIPAELDQATLLLVGHYYLNREAVGSDNLAELPLAVEALCEPHRIPVLK